MAANPDAPAITSVASAYAGAVTEDLRLLVGVDLTVEGPKIDLVESNAVLAADAPVAVTTAQAKDGSTEPFLFVVGRPEAAALASLSMGQDEEQAKEIGGKALDSETLDAFGEVMNLCTGVLSRIFTEDYGIPAVGLSSTEEVEAPRRDQSWIERGSYVALRYTLSIPGHGDAQMHLVFPRSVVDAWFEIDVEGGLQSLEGSTRGEGEVESTSIVFIDASDDDRKQVEDLEEELGHSVWALSPDEFDPEELDEFEEVGAFFIEWDLGVRPGLDLLEVLRADEKLSGLPIIIAMTKPSDGLVRCALRCGADSVVMKPYEVEEIVSRLNPLLLERQQTRQ